MLESNKLNDLTIHNKINEWEEEVELLLKSIAEKAQIYRLLHIECHNKFKRKYYYLTIPIIILSSLTGSANLALGSFSTENDSKITNLVIGVFGIVITIISTLNNFFNFQSRKIEHYNSSKEWFRIQRLIEVELSIQRDKRNSVNSFFHLILQEIEKIHSNQPNIRTDVINMFLKKYKKKHLDLDLPEILKLKKIKIVKPLLQTDKEQINNINNEECIRDRSTESDNSSIDSQDALNIIVD